MTPHRFQRICLHIGTEKTGTSSIQHLLARNRVKLTQQGFYYPKLGHGGSQWEFAGIAQDTPWNNDIGKRLGITNTEAQAIFQQKLTAQLNQEFNAHTKCHTLIISCEHFHSRLTNTAQITRLREFLQKWTEEFCVIVYLRRQDQYAISRYSTAIKSGGLPQAVFQQFQPNAIPHHLDYEKLLKLWEECFTPAAMKVRRFTPNAFHGGSLLTDFAHCTGFSLNELSIPPLANQSLTQQGLDFLAEVNRQFQTIDDGRHHELRREIVGMVSDLASGKSQLATKQEAANFLEKFAASNEQIRQRYFPKQEAPLFESDLSSYPEILPSQAPSHADATTLAIKLVETLLEQSIEQEQQLKQQTTRSNALQAENYYLQAILLSKNNQPEAAINLLKKVLHLKPKHPEATFVLAKLLIQSGDHIQGKAYLAQVQGLAPANQATYDKFLTEYENNKSYHLSEKPADTNMTDNHAQPNHDTR